MKSRASWDTQTRIYKVDKSEWQEGRWTTETDRMEFEHAGLTCIVLRNDSGSLCGYVAVPKGHPLYGDESPDLHVHGGITFAGQADRRSPRSTAEPLKTATLWWFGFDCSHISLGDLVPEMHARIGEPKKTDLKYLAIGDAHAITCKLADEIASVA